jgi:hypothetical protein
MVSHNAKGTLSCGLSRRFLAAFGVKTPQKYKIFFYQQLFCAIFFKKQSGPLAMRGPDVFNAKHQNQSLYLLLSGQ